MLIELKNQKQKSVTETTSVEILVGKKGSIEEKRKEKGNEKKRGMIEA
jgi:hypothetical protein